jgi:putative DNA methylase
MIKELVQWENTANERVLSAARAEIWKSWRRACADNYDHPRAKELFDPNKLPAFHDPFAGGGSLPLEAQRLGLTAYASDLNPVAVLICKALIEIPPKFAGKPAINPESRKQRVMAHTVSHGAQGLAEDVRYYGKWVRDEAERRLGGLYPKVEITAEMAKDRPDLKPLVGRNLGVIAWLWTRTVKSPNPAFGTVDVPLVATFVLSTKPGKESYVQPIVENGKYYFTVKRGKASDPEATKSGTKLSRGSFRCLLSGVPIPYEYIDGEANGGRMGARLMAVVAEGERGRVYLAPTPQMEATARSAQPIWKPDAPSRGTWASNAQGRRYGFVTFGDYFTPRQLVALTTLSDLVQEARDRAFRDATAINDGNTPREDGALACADALVASCNDTGASSYADAIATYLGLTVSRVSDYGCTITTWANNPQMEIARNAFARQGIAMTWDYAETNPLGPSSGSFEILLSWIVKVLQSMHEKSSEGFVFQADAMTQDVSKDKVVSTDPPYFDNIGYADLSDFFYVWLRRALRPVVPELFSTVAVPKEEELIAAPYRQGGKEKAEAFFVKGMTKVMRRLAEQAHPGLPVTIYYAFKQAETGSEEGTASTGWETFLEALITSGFCIRGTWPIRTERQGRSVGIDTNVLASSIVLVCAQHPMTPRIATRREFVGALRAELPEALAHLQRGNVAPVDLAQAAIGPGMAIYTRYSKVVDAEGKPLPVREALALINQTLDEVLAEQEGDFDADTRWAVAWFDQSGFADGDYGIAETLSKAKNTSISGLEQAGILKSKAGKVHLLRPEELPADWDPVDDSRLTVWEAVHHLIRRLDKSGEAAAAELAGILGGMAETARELAYRLYTICERKKRTQEALSYNALVQSWPEITRLARDGVKTRPQQAGMFT